MPDIPADAISAAERRQQMSADSAQVYISHGDGWTHIGETDGPIRMEVPGVDHEDASEPFRLPGPITITVDTSGFNAALKHLTRTFHDLDAVWRPRWHRRRCPDCKRRRRERNPRVSRPLKVDGQEYNRRRKARMRKRRRIA